MIVDFDCQLMSPVGRTGPSFMIVDFDCQLMNPVGRTGPLILSITELGVQVYRNN